MTSPSHPPITAVLFDLDDTLIDTRKAVILLYGHWYRTLPPRARPATEREFIARMFEPYPEPLSLTDVYERMLDIWHGCFPSVEAAVEAHAAAMPDMVALDPRTEAMLRDLRSARVPVGVVTNGGGFEQRAKVRSTGVDGLVDAVVVSGEFGASKPDPAIFERALSLIGADASETLFVGDNPSADIGGAKGVGMRAAWMRHGREWRIAAYSPDYAVQSVLEIPPLLRIAAR